MTQRITNGFANDLLNRLEDLELPLLSWGVTEGALAETEVLEVIDGALLRHPEAPNGATAEEVLDVCRDLALLWRIPGSSPPRYRTRLAEALRLATGLRQLFPPRSWADEPQAGWWQHGKRLIADYRLHTAPRRYPERDISSGTVLDELTHLGHWGDVHARVATALLQDLNLARFQVDAARSIFDSLQRNQSKGVIVGAGTGSGKTLAFYLPALAAMAEQARPGESNRVHTLALYPRKELLRDQLREAVRNTERIASALGQAGRRPLRIGALYGDTPRNTRDWRLQGGARTSGAWARTRDGAVCPYLTCPQPNCGIGEMLWSDADRLQGREALTCLSCGYRLAEGRVILTRDSLRRKGNAPDLLFTTTEMLNRNSADPGLSGLLGWRGTGPSLVLLDEVHTYSGLHGAQVALLLRRWRDAVRGPMTFVGLSATLRDADRFFGQLIGLPPSAVDAVEPAEGSMVAEGREYALALRGDPVAGASLLSTSIQTAMLFGRVLDPEEDRFLFGSTGFLFTDDLDVTNRFYDDLRDAEGGQSRSGRSGRKPVLAGLRASERPEHAARYRDGQSWDLVEKVGHDLDPGLHLGNLRIGRTSSQDVGVDLEADLTVATASLEVGFNDPRVGLVLQHKAPRNAAAFIQRRGRAGRVRGTRPITVVALSDYGRDRLAYQGYETLFAPEVSASSLPIGNRFVLKIQGTQALLDWLGRKLRSKGLWADPRILLAASKDRLRPEDGPAREGLVVLLRGLLDDSRLQDELAAHLGRALQVSADEVQALLWEQPRSLLLAVVPTTLRRLSSRWTPLRDDPGATAGSLLPEFITRTLFDPLNLPEVELTLPFDGNGDIERLPIARALREAVPGRVSRRYGHQRDEHRTWLPLPAPDSNTLSLTDLISDGIPEGLWHPYGQDPAGVEVVRPRQLALEAPPSEISDRSQGRPRWGTQIIVPEDTPLSREVPPEPSPWVNRIQAISFATHAAGNPVEVRRMTTGAQCEVSYERGGNENREVRYTLRGQPAALGFRLGVDAMRLVLAPMDLTDSAVTDYLAAPQWRSLAFAHAVAEDVELTMVSNTFQRERLAQVYLTAFALGGLVGERTGEQMRSTLANGAWAEDLPEIFRVLYRDADVNGQALDNDRLVAGLMDLTHDPRVIAAVDRAAQLLVVPDVATRTADLAQRAYRDTLAAAILAAVMRACPDAQDGDLIIDVLPGAEAGDPSVVWLSETSVGGLGIIENLVRFYGQDPRRFWGLVSSSLAPSDYEYVDATLTRLLEHLAAAPGGEAASAMATLRAAVPAVEADQALQTLRSAWGRLDGPPRRTAVAALSTRLLRPGSGPDTDAAALGLVTAWASLEQRLGIEIDARVVAYAVGKGHLALGSSRRLTADQAFSLLWPRGRQARTQDLEHYQPYGESPVLDRLLVRAAHDDRLPQVDVTAADWVLSYQKAMTENAAVELVCPAGDGRAMADALVRVPAAAVDRDVLRVYGEVRGFARYQDQLRVRVELREAIQ